MGKWAKFLPKSSASIRLISVGLCCSCFCFFSTHDQQQEFAAARKLLPMFPVACRLDIPSYLLALLPSAAFPLWAPLRGKDLEIPQGPRGRSLPWPFGHSFRQTNWKPRLLLSGQPTSSRLSSFNFRPDEQSAAASARVYPVSSLSCCPHLACLLFPLLLWAGGRRDRGTGGAFCRWSCVHCNAVSSSPRALGRKWADAQPADCLRPAHTPLELCALLTVHCALGLCGRPLGLAWRSPFLAAPTCWSKKGKQTK